MILPRGQRAFVELLNPWLKLMETTVEPGRLHGYWILGKDAADTGPRWSVIRDVLGWVELYGRLLVQIQRRVTGIKRRGKGPEEIQVFHPSQRSG